MGEQLLELGPEAAQRDPWVGSPPLTGSGPSGRGLCGWSQLRAPTRKGQGAGGRVPALSTQLHGKQFVLFFFIRSFPRQNKIIFCTLTRLRKKRQ